MPPLPRKQAVALDLLERTSVFVHLDPRRPGVIVPQGFLKQPQLVLQIGLNMAIAIPDLNVGDEGISCTLSFNKRPHFCSLPWAAIYALIGEQGGGMVWPEDVPPEVVSQQRAAAKKDARPKKPGLRAISGSGAGSASAGATDGPGGEAADRSSDEGDMPSTRRSESPLRPAEVRRGDSSAMRASRPPRLVQVVSNPARSESAPINQAAEEASLSSENPARESQARDEPRPEISPRDVPAPDDAARPPATKRSRPPYLRLVD